MTTQAFGGNGGAMVRGEKPAAEARPSPFSRAVKDAMRQGLRSAQIARAFEVSLSTVFRWSSGTIRPRVATQRRVLAELPRLLSAMPPPEDTPR